MSKYQTKRNQGFTIIEVLIVLAIAGLIMLAVFLAVPALQRNQRNSQRTSDASQIASSITQCLSNRNGLVASCDTLAELQGTGLDTAKLQQLTTVTVGAGDPTMPAAGTNDTAAVGFTAKCSAAGDAVDAAGSSRQAAILFRIETPGGDTTRCVEV